MNNDNNKADEDFRRVLATATKLESLQSNPESVIDFFLAPATKLHAKLCKDCLKLLFGQEFKLDYYRKAEELVWRRIYHDLYKFQKTKKPLIKRQDSCLIESHFISGVGFYSSLIIRLRSHYKVNATHGFVAPLNLSFGPIDNFSCDRRLNNEDEQFENTDHDNSMFVDEGLKGGISGTAQEWARQAIYRSLVYMGDLARYLMETSQFNFRSLAFKFYFSASRNQPEYGLPFNQLATLAGGINHNLDAVCNYMRCSLRAKPFEGAEGNMMKIFELNDRFYDDISHNDHAISFAKVISSKDPSLAAESLVRAVIVIFIKVVSDIRAAICHDVDKGQLENIIQETRLFFENLREALELEPIPFIESHGENEHGFAPISSGSNNSRRLRYVSPTIMYELCSISLMLIAECQKRRVTRATTLDPVQDNLMDLVNTLALNLLHYATTKCYKMVIAKVQELRIRRSESNTCNESMMRSSCSNNSVRSSENINSMSDSVSKRNKSRIRQRRAVANFADDNKSSAKPQNCHSDDSDLSELEETALSTIDALDISSGMSEEVDHEAIDLIDLSSASDEELSARESRRKLIGSAISLRGDCGLSKPAVRQTRSQNYDMLRLGENVHSSSSLPVPDLLTGDNLNEAMSESIDLVGFNDNGSDKGLIQDDSLRHSYKISDESDFESVMSHIYSQTYLPTVKILCDWLLTDSMVISSNLPSFREFCDELDEMVVSLNDLKKLTSIRETCNISIRDSSDEEKISDSPILRHSYNGPDWTQRYPLSCDHPLFYLGPLKSVHERNIDFTYPEELTSSESGFITIQCVIAFSHALSAFLENKNL